LPEKIKFLKEQSGTGGGTKRGGDEWHDAKGIAYMRGETIGNPDCKVTMKWSEVAERIDRLISEGKYITQDDIDHLIKDCKWTVQNYDPADSDKYDKMEAAYLEYAPEMIDGHSVFEIPVTGFDYRMPVKAETTAMSEPHMIDYTLYFDSSTIKK
jgi:hypothetical protein